MMQRNILEWCCVLLLIVSTVAASVVLNKKSNNTVELMQSIETMRELITIYTLVNDYNRASIFQDTSGVYFLIQVDSITDKITLKTVENVK